MPESIKLVVGLGNPGQRYQDTRHNIGQILIKEWARNLGVKLKGKWGVPAWTVRVQGNSRPFHLALLKSYMNESGFATKRLLKRFNILPGELLTVFDDLDLNFGKIRIRQKGSSGGHRGLQSIIDNLGTNNIPRLRVGIGPLPQGTDAVDYVLGRWTAGEMEKMNEVKEQCIAALRHVLNHDITTSMNQFNM